MSAECTVCQDSFKTPKVLPCGHTFCETCIATWAGRVQHPPRQRRTQYTCPECRENHTMPFGGASKLPTNVALLRMNYESIENPQPGPSGVGPKKQKKAENKICETHGETKATFCMTCSLVICNDCVQMYASGCHDMHIQVPLKDHISALNAKLFEILEQNKVYVTTLRNWHAIWLEAGRKSQDSCTGTLALIQQRRKLIHDSIERYFTDTSNKVKAKDIKSKESNNQVINSVRDTVEAAELLHSRIDGILGQGTTADLLDMYESVFQSSQKVSEMVQKLSLDRPKCQKLTIDSVNAFHDVVGGMFGTLEETSEFMFHKPVLVSCFNTRHEGDIMENNVSDVAITEDGHIAVVDSAHWNIKLFTQTGVLRKIMFKDKPAGTYTRVKAIPGHAGHLLVLEQDRFLKWHIASNSLDTFYIQPHELSPNDYSHAVGITSHNKSPVIGLANAIQKKMHLVDFEGRPVEDLDLPVDESCVQVAGNPHQDFFVLYSLQLEKLTAYKGKEMLWSKSLGNSEIPSMCGVVMDCDGNMLVARSDSNTVSHFSRSGEMQSVLLEFGDKLNGPQSIAYNRDHDLLVIAESRGNIKVYKW